MDSHKRMLAAPPVILMLVACAMSPAERLRHDFLDDVYWPAASACEREYRDFHVERVFVAGEVVLDVDAGQSQYLSAPSPSATTATFGKGSSSSGERARPYRRDLMPRQLFGSTRVISLP
jgi:hypothetical protein